MQLLIDTPLACNGLTLISLHERIAPKVAVLNVRLCHIDANYTKRIYCKTLGVGPAGDPAVTDADDECKHGVRAATPSDIMRTGLTCKGGELAIERMQHNIKAKYMVK